MKSEKKDKIVLGIFSLIIIGVISFRAYSLTGIQHAFDESGYWSSAAFFSNLNWKELASNNLYYSYGYGFLLFIILKLVPAKFLYQAAIAVNVLIIIGCLCLIFAILKKLFPNIKKNILLCTAFVLTIYPYNLFYAHLTVSEVLLSFLYLLVLWTFLELLEKNKIWLWVVFAVLLGYMYMVHQRTIGIIIASLICLALYTSKDKKKIVSFFLFLGVLFVLFVLSSKIKENYLSSWFEGSQSASLNDYSGQTSKIKLMLSLQGLIKLIFSVLGKWYGICASTFMLVSFGLFGMLKEILTSLRGSGRKKKFSNKLIFSLFCILCFLACFGINCIFFIEPENYADYLIYTRYTELALLPILCCGIFRLVFKKISKMEVFINCCVIIILTAVVFVWLSDTGLRDYVGQANIAIWDLYTEGMNIEQFILRVTLRTLIIGLILYGISFARIGKFIIFSIIAFIWFGSTYSAYQKDGETRTSNDIQNVRSMIEKEVTSNDLYYYIGDGNNAVVNAFYLQLKDPNEKIHILDSWGDVQKLAEGEYVLTNQLAALQGKNFESFIIVDKTNSYVLLKKDFEQ